MTGQTKEKNRSTKLSCMPNAFTGERVLPDLQDDNTTRSLAEMVWNLRQSLVEARECWRMQLLSCLKPHVPCWFGVDWRFRTLHAKISHRYIRSPR
jgi:hypothetical protein